MEFFGAYTYYWWELGLLKFSLIALGIIIGGFWPAFFKKRPVTIALWIIFAVPALYLAYVSIQQAG